MDMAKRQSQPKGKYLRIGPSYDVCNVIGSSWDTGNKKDFWEENVPEGVEWPDECQIVDLGGKPCTSDARVGGHVWVKRRWEFWYILPICQGCNKNPDYDDPNYVKTRQRACLVARNRGDSKRMEDMKEGDCLHGVNEVSYDPQPGAPRQAFWCQRANCTNFSKEKCHICDKYKATMVGRMWLRSVQRLQFLLPLCDKCKEDQDLRWKKRKPTKQTAILVAVNN